MRLFDGLGSEIQCAIHEVRAPIGKRCVACSSAARAWRTEAAAIVQDVSASQSNRGAE